MELDFYPAPLPPFWDLNINYRTYGIVEGAVSPGGGERSSDGEGEPVLLEEGEKSTRSCGMREVTYVVESGPAQKPRGEFLPCCR